MRFVYVEPGSFEMGSNKWTEDEKPPHKVNISRGFWLGQFEVVQSEWKHVMGTQPWEDEQLAPLGPYYPAVNITWKEAQGFLRRLGDLESCDCYRLPTEAEWEYAAKAGRRSGFVVKPMLPPQAANTWGFYGMLDGPWEWTADWFGAYTSREQTDPTGPHKGKTRVLRGGDAFSEWGPLLMIDRWQASPKSRLFYIGFRVVRDLSP